MFYRTVFLVLSLVPTLVGAANLQEHLGDLQATLRPALDTAPREQPVAPADASHFSVAPLAGVLTPGHCTTVTLEPEQSSCVRIEICPECAQ